MKNDKTLTLWFFPSEPNSNKQQQKASVCAWVCMCWCTCTVLPAIFFPWWQWQCVALNERFFQCRFEYLGFVLIFVTLWLSHFILALFVASSLRHHSPIPLVSGKCSLSLVSPFFLPSLITMWGSGHFIPQVSCRLSLSTNALCL